MMKAKRIKKWLMGLTVAAAIALQGMTALAASGGVPEKKTGSITIVPSFTNDASKATAIAESAWFDIYKVGEVKPGTSVTEFDLTGGAFAGFNDVEITKKTMEDKAAELPIALAKYAAAHEEIKSVHIKSNDIVTPVPEGLYLAVQTTSFEHYYDVLPFLIIMPEGSSSGYSYEVTSRPKTTAKPVEVDPPVEKVIKDVHGGSISSDEVFRFTMTPKDGAPMPEGTAAGATKEAVAPAGGVEFGLISFSKPGVYTYEFKEFSGVSSKWNYDHTVYTMTVKVNLDKETGILNAEKTITKDGKETVDTIVFTNEYKGRSESDSPSGGGSGGSSDGGSTTPGSTPETEPGRVLGAHRDGPGSGQADAPAGRVLGASRRARTGDSSSMMLYGAVFCGAVVLLGVWGVSKKRKKDADQA